MEPKLKPVAGVLAVDPKVVDEAEFSVVAAVVALPKKNELPNGAAGAAVVTVAADEPNDSVVAAAGGFTCD